MLLYKTGPWVFRGRSANEIYQDLVATIRLEGEESSPRGFPTTELLHVVTRIEDPRRRVLTQIGRGLNPFFNLAESLWILRGQSEADWICFFNSQLRKYLDPPLRAFHGAYGERLRCWPQVTQMGHATGREAVRRDQLLDCYFTLRDGPDSRQAVMVLWNPLADHYGVQSLDRPCNDAVAFKLRRGALWMSVFNRSNDVVLGLTSTNIVQFSTIQEALASWLNVAVGPYTHYSDSLHLYDSQSVVTGAPFDVYAYVAPTPMAPQSPGAFDAGLEWLYREVGLQSQLLGQPQTDQELERIEYRWTQPAPGPAQVACPYWQSVAWALLAYCFHKRKDPRGAGRCVGRMIAADWQVECLRFLADRYGADSAFQSQAATILAALPLREGVGLEGRQALWGYVFQSHPAVPSSD